MFQVLFAFKGDLLLIANWGAVFLSKDLNLSILTRSTPHKTSLGLLLLESELKKNELVSSDRIYIIFLFYYITIYYMIKISDPEFWILEVQWGFKWF